MVKTENAGDLKKRVWRLSGFCYAAGGLGGAGGVELAHAQTSLGIGFLIVGFSFSIFAAASHVKIDDEIERQVRGD
jgi:hypothetical protein